MIDPRRTLSAFVGIAMSVSLAALFAAPAQGGSIRSATTTMQPSSAGDTVRAIGTARITGQADSTCYVWTLPTDGTPAPLRRCYVGKREADTILVVRPTTARPLTLSPVAYFKNKVSETKNVTITVSPYNWPAPVIDSVRIDTTQYAIEAAAFRDSFPAIVYRESRGRPGKLLVGETLRVCALARNRYTGAVHILAQDDVTDAQADDILTACASAAEGYATERSG